MAVEPCVVVMKCSCFLEEVCALKGDAFLHEKHKRKLGGGGTVGL